MLSADTALNADYSTTGTLNFAREGGEDGVWSNANAGLTKQSLNPVSVAIRDARAHPTSLDEEGFVLVRDPLTQPRWDDPAWVQSVYLPQCQALVRRLTGADKVLSLGNIGVLVRRAGASGTDQAGAAAPPARFVHLDISPESALPFIAASCPDVDLSRYRSIRMFNIWRSLSPSPQNTPLAICDMRSVTRELLKEGRTVGADYASGVPYLSPLYSPDQRFSYFPNIGPDEAIVFMSVRVLGDGAIGCPHSAFDVPDPDPLAPPRESVEARVVALTA
jgi:hypothetical protein